MYSREKLDEIKSKITDYYEWYKQYLPELKISGSNRAFSPCCFHSEMKPSLCIDLNYGMWRCFGSCNTGGDIFSFYSRYFNISFSETVETLAEQFGVTLEVDPEVQKEIDLKKRQCKANEIICLNFMDKLEKTPEGLNYLINERGFTRSMIKAFKLGVGIDDLHLRVNENIRNGLCGIGLIKQREDGSYYSTFRSNRIIIPRIDEKGNVVSFTGRLFIDPPEGKSEHKYMHTTNNSLYDKSKFIFGLHQARKHIKHLNSAIICEGEFDCIKCHQAGIVNSICLSGLNISDEQVNMLKKYTDTFYVCVEDNAILNADTNGRTNLDKFYAKIRQYIPYAKVYIIDLRGQNGEKCDPDMYFLNHTRDEFVKLIKQAKIYNEYIINSKLTGVNPKNIEEKTACLNMLVPQLISIQNFMDRKQYIELVANKLMLSENDIYRKLKYYTEKQDKINTENITWDSRPVYAQKILLSMCFCQNLCLKEVLAYIVTKALRYMEPFYTTIFNNYIFEYVKKWVKENGEAPVDFTEFFNDLNSEDSNNLIRKTIMDAYFKAENLEDFTDEDIEELVSEQCESLMEYSIPTYESEDIECLSV